jgi:hypothetical protein
LTNYPKEATGQIYREPELTPKGGLLKIISLVLLFGLLICFSFTPLPSESQVGRAAVSAARSWLALVDVGHYAGSWKEASGYFQDAVFQQSWEASLEGVRKPLGKLIRRKVINTQEASNLPGAPDGQYVVMMFETTF